jgi:hypothetical protein
LDRFPAQEPDHRRPIGKGLRSIAQIVSGSIRITSSTLEEEFFSELHYTVSSGMIERDPEGNLIWAIKIAAPFHALQQLLSALARQTTSSPVELENCLRTLRAPPTSRSLSEFYSRKVKLSSTPKIGAM